MKITKFGHCCLLIEVEGLRILTDPGAYSTLQKDVPDVDVILITHEHPDHLHIESLKNVLEHTKQVVVITNTSVGKILDKEGISYQIIEHGQKTEVRGVVIEGFGKKHAEIYKTALLVDNTGYFIANKLFYPGDAFTLPGKPVDILALPVAGPWMKISEALEYALQLHPKRAFPVHDGMFLPGRGSLAHRMPANVLTSAGIQFVVIEEGKSFDFLE